MNIFKKSLIRILIAAVLLINAVPLKICAYNGDYVENGVEEISKRDYYVNYTPVGNINDQDYMRWACPVLSYMAVCPEGVLKIDAGDECINISLYSETFELISENYKKIEAELPVFGGFYSGENGYYIVYGQNNGGCVNGKEVFRVVKYDKNFNRLGSDSLFGANTAYPFWDGSLRMAEYGGYLYIRTCHKMYNGHQANVMIEFDENEMNIVDSFTKVLNISSGYVSHSFNQFIMIDDDANIVGYDHGDFYPRAAVVGRYGKKAGHDTFCGDENPENQWWNYYPVYESAYALEFQSAEDPDNMYLVNATGAAIGDIAYSSENYLASGTSVVQDANFSEDNARNIFISVINRDNFESQVKWITSYSRDDIDSASAPHLVKINDNKFFLIWNVNSREYVTRLRSATGKVSYVFIDGNGNMLGDIKTVSGNISDCDPILLNNNVCWYTFDGNQTKFYRIDGNGSLTGIADRPLPTPTQQYATATPTATPTQQNIIIVPIGTRQPNVTAAPTGTRQPNVTAAPTGTRQPNVTAAPTGTRQPNATAAPTGTRQPNATAVPTTVPKRITYVSNKKVSCVRGEVFSISINGIDKSNVYLKGKGGVYDSNTGEFSVSGKGTVKLFIIDAVSGKKNNIAVFKCVEPKMKNLKMQVGKSKTIKLKGFNNVFWTSSDKKVATVSGGTVNAVSVGTSTITAYINGHPFSSRVTVLAGK